MTDIQELRENIRRIDHEMLGLMKKRLALAEEIGLYKIKNGQEIVDDSIERKVIERYRAFAEENGMDPDDAEAICRILIRGSVRLQMSLR